MISVIIPVYKSEKYLNRCVDSVLSQTYSDLEVILVDDGSPDNCGVICEEYKSRDKRVAVIHKSNGGVSSARNAGLDFATGDYVAFVDSDDFIDPTMYDKLLTAMRPDDDIVMCDFMMYSQGTCYPKETIASSADKVTLIRNLLLADVGSGSVYILIKKSLLKVLRFPENVRNGEDFWFLLRLFAMVGNVTKICVPLYYYNLDNNNSLTHTLNFKTDADCVSSYNENQMFLEQIGLFDSVKKEWYWNILRFKSTFVLTPSRFKLYRSVIPDANAYVYGCPLLSTRIKLIMNLLNKHLDIIVLPIVWGYNFYRRIKLITSPI